MSDDWQSREDFYNSYLARYPLGEGWPSKEYADRVYSHSTSLFRNYSSNVKSVIDVGCGAGGLDLFLRSILAYDKSYLGIEENDYLLSVATDRTADQKSKYLKSRFPDKALKNETFDWAFVIGTLGTDQKSKSEYDKAFLKEVCCLSRIGITVYVNDISLIPHERLESVPGLFAHDPLWIARTMSEFVSFSEVSIRREELGRFGCAVDFLIERPLIS
ncbi:MAG: hypothetical protein EON95_09230 [Caulobacteraceae bacterium]|nr:MAG: hypothetical protein EON95_09230 [Caulobacteraceae bacterium]